jgi:hypothetical protein
MTTRALNVKMRSQDGYGEEFGVPAMQMSLLPLQ